MITIEFVRDLFAHMEWADARIWAAVPGTTPPDEALRSTLVHIHLVQRAFFYVWTGRPFTDAVRKAEEFPTLADVRTWAQPYYAEARAHLDTLTDERLGEPIAMPWAQQIEAAFGFTPATTRVGDTCFQVASHTTHHRGQVNIRLRALGMEPPMVDYIFWVWSGRPTPQWS
jgi:uncharacterized damage-inducible protein DinB